MIDFCVLTLKMDLKTPVCMYERERFGRGSRKLAHARVYIDFSLEAVSQTCVSEPGVNVAIHTTET